MTEALKGKKGKEVPPEIDAFEMLSKLGRLVENTERKIYDMGVNPNDLPQWRENFMQDVKSAQKKLRGYDKDPDKKARRIEINRLMTGLEGRIMSKVMAQAEGERVTRPPVTGTPLRQAAPKAATAPVEPEPPKAEVVPEEAPEPVEAAPEPAPEEKEDAVNAAPPEEARAPEPAAETGLPENVRRPSESQDAYADRIAGTDFGSKLDAEFPKVNAKSTPFEKLKASSPAEQAKIMRRSVAEIQDLLAERAGVKGERDAMKAAGEAYFLALKEVHKTKSHKSRDLASKVMRVRAENLEKAYNKARSEYADALRDSRGTRLEKKGITGERADKVLERYDRAVRKKEILNNVVIPAQELKLRAQTEGFGERERGLFSRGLEWYANKNQKLEAWSEKTFGKKWGKYFAAGTRALTTAAIVTVPVTIGAAFGSAGILAALSYGAWRIGRAVLFATGGTSITETAFGLFDKRKGGKQKREAARAELGEVKENVLSELDAGGLKAFEDKMAALAKAGDEGAAQKQKAKLRLAVSLVLGGGAAGISELMSIHEAAAMASDPSVMHALHGDPFAHHGSSLTHSHRGSMDGIIRPDGAGNVEHAAPTPGSWHVANADRLTVSIDKHGEGAYQLWKDMKQRLIDEGYSLDDKKLAPGIRHILESKPRDLAEQYDFHHSVLDTAARESGVMHEGDVLGIKANGDIYFTPNGDSTVTLAHANADGTLTEGRFGGGYRPDQVAHAETAHEASHTAEQSGTHTGSGRPETPGELKADELMRNYPQGNVHPANIPPPPPHMDFPPPSHEYVPHPMPQPEYAPHITPVQPEHPADVHPAPPQQAAPAPHVEAPPQASAHVDTAPTVESPSSAIESVSRSPLWGSYHDRNLWDLVYQQPSAGSPEYLLRQSMFNVLRETGVGPLQGEHLADYLARANAAVLNHTAEHTGIYQVQGHYIAHGGDLIARQTLALDYAAQHHVETVVANAGGFSKPVVSSSGAAFYPDGTLPQESIDIGITPQPSDYVNPVF